MKSTELRNKKTDELQMLLHELLDEQFKMRMQKVMGQMENTHRFKEIRQDIARVKTVLNEG